MPIKEQEIPNWNALPTTYQVFIKGLSTGIGYIFDQKEALHYTHLLLNPKETLAKIDTLLTKLKSYEVKPSNTTDIRVRKGWKLLRNFLKGNEGILRPNDIHFFVCGSMQYNDPRNLDIDGLFVTDKLNINLENIHFNQFRPQLDHLFTFPANRGNGNGTGHVSLETIEDHCRRIEEGDNEFALKFGEQIEGDLSEISIILSGYPLGMSPSDVRLLREKARSLMGSSPLLSAIVCTTLEETIGIRVERRKSHLPK